MARTLTLESRRTDAGRRKRDTRDDEIESLREQLLHAQKLSSLGALASTIVHEFNNILTAVINHCAFALSVGAEPTMRRALERIQTAGQRATALTNSMLGFAAKRDRKVEETAVGELVLETLGLVERDLVKHDVRLRQRIDLQAKAVINANQIQQVVLNLLVNARQAMPDGGTVTVSVTEDAHAEHVVISIADTGVGMPPAIRRKVFDPFFTTRSTGTGLGLSVSREIARRHGGDLCAESVAGKGTTMTLLLPGAVPAKDPRTTRRRKSA